MASNPNKILVVVIGLGLLVPLLVLYKTVEPARRNSGETNPDSITAAPIPADVTLYKTYSGSASCRECHEKAFVEWQNSHHALAERSLNPAIDKEAFDPPRSFKHGSQTSSVRIQNGQYQLITRGLDGQQKPYPVARSLGVFPLWQYLVPGTGGRYQMTELAYDPARREWFDVYGNEDRQPGEWGHWSGRGMTWNVMCAGCHNTRLRKNYSMEKDAYQTARAEMGVGCEACHGACAEHVAWQQSRTNIPPQLRPKDPTVLRLSKDQTLSLCGNCHSRRGELTGDFVPGDSYWDHFMPSIPDESDIYYPDGQVRDEDFEFVSFLGSRMHSLGVRCLDCHNVHTGKILSKNNDLCLRCHKGSIDPLAHGHHPLNKAGSLCVDCHMPITVYMARHPRRDHGLTIPDPQLTKEFNIPNACSRCHADKPLDWNIDAVNRWYGSRMKRHTQIRARWMAQARTSDINVTTNLIQMIQTESIPMWRASAALLLRSRLHIDSVQEALCTATSDPSPLVRASAARALEPLAHAANPRAVQHLETLCADPFRLPRIEAAWGLRTRLDTNSLAGNDLLRSLKQNVDQPTGMLQWGLFQLDRNQPVEALECFRKAVQWDTHSPPLRQALAVSLSLLGKKEEAAKELEVACKAIPRDAGLQFNLGLALAEIKQLAASLAAFEKAVQLDPQFSRAWYNLGLARSSDGQPQKALEALEKAESLEPQSPDAPYARATILYQQGRLSDARMAARRALEIDPQHESAAALLRLLQQ